MLVVELVEVTEVVGGTVVVGFNVLEVGAVVDGGSATVSGLLAQAENINESTNTSIDTRFIVD